jgi:hypothetical protein
MQILGYRNVVVDIVEMCFEQMSAWSIVLILICIRVSIAVEVYIKLDK